MRVALSSEEKNNVQSLHLHSSATQLNSYIKMNHAQIRKEERLKAKEIKEAKNSKNNKLLEGLNIKKPNKEVKPTSQQHSATLINAARMIKFTEVGEEYSRSDLQHEFNIPTAVVSEILLFLSKYTNVVFEETRNHRLKRIQ